MDKTPEEIVDEVEIAIAESHACPYCGMYDGTHMVTCPYLKHKGNVDASRIKPKGSRVREEDKEVKEEISDDKELLDKMKPKEK